MYEREENAQFSLISYSKERRFRVFQTLPDSWKNKKLLQVLRWFLKLMYYKDYLGKRWRNAKIHDCQPILENYRHWLLSLYKVSLSLRWNDEGKKAVKTKAEYFKAWRLFLFSSLFLSNMHYWPSVRWSMRLDIWPNSFFCILLDFL